MELDILTETTTPARPDCVALAIADADAAIGKYSEELRERIAKAEAYAPEIAIAAEFVRAFPALAGEAADEYQRPLRIGLTLDPNTVNALMVNLDVVRLVDVTEPLKWLAQRFGAYAIDDYPELGRRAYIFENSGRPVRFQVFFNGEAAQCKFVKVGVKEEPVYKLMCGEAEIA